MSDILLYPKELGLKAPRLVSNVQLDEELQRITVAVDYVHNSDLVCSVSKLAVIMIPALELGVI